MGKRKVKAPVYEQWAGNEYTDRARQNIGTYGDWVNSNWENLTRTYSPEDMTDLAKKAYQTTLDDFSQEYNKQANAIASRNYNRFGGLGSTPSLYTQDMFNKQMNDYNARLMSQMYGMADQLANNQMNRNLTSLGTVYGMYNDAGKLATALDQDNWNVRNKNIEARYVADLQNAQNSFNFGNMLSGLASGITGGAKVGGLPGGIVGGVLGGISGGFSGASGDQVSQLGNTFGNIGGNTTNWLRTKGQGFTWR